MSNGCQHRLSLRPTFLYPTFTHRFFFLRRRPGGLLINLVGVSWDWSATASRQKVQVRSLMRLKNMVDIQFYPTAWGSGWWCTLGATLTQDAVVHVQPNQPCRHVE